MRKIWVHRCIYWWLPLLVESLCIYRVVPFHILSLLIDMEYRTKRALPVECQILQIYGIPICLRGLTPWVVYCFFACLLGLSLKWFYPLSLQIWDIFTGYVYMLSGRVNSVFLAPVPNQCVVKGTWIIYSDICFICVRFI